jgi:hypothetical protein
MNNKKEICYFCYGNHNCRDCNIEKKLKSTISIKVGLTMEEYIQEFLKCIYCNEYSLKKIGYNCPSLDLQCEICNKKIEIKSKCFSIDKLPNNIDCKGGHFEHLQNNINYNNLDMILVIYGVDRKKKEIKIKEVFWIKNNLLTNYDLIEIKKNNNLSLISIKNIDNLEKVYIDKKNIISFKNWIEKLINNYKRINYI